MSTPPASPRIYHITHVDNLAGILAEGGLVSDATIMGRGGPSAMIGYSHIKERRVAMPVKCYPETRVGEYVPFYFCPRSVMLYVIHRGGQGDLAYRDGQDPILHFEADLHRVVEWANGQGRRWAFTKSNAGAYYSDAWCQLEDLDQVNWDAVAAMDWRAQEVKEAKQAEFLVQDTFPWKLVARVCVRNALFLDRVESTIREAGYDTPVQTRSQWYY